MAELIWLVRHGSIDRPQPHRFLGQGDPPLNPLGIRQARALHARLSGLDFAEVFCSPLRRAVTTAALISGRPESALRRETGLVEIDLGDWEGLSVAEVRERFPGAYERRGADLAHARPRNGESFADLEARAWPVLEAAAATVRRSGKPVLMVAHAGVNRVLLARLLGRPMAEVLEIPQGYAAVNRLRVTPDRVLVEAMDLRLSDRDERGKTAGSPPGSRS
ncbi:MAG: histidine phosphatase family protein [Desulfobulbus sp.]